MCSERDSPLEPFVLPAPGQPELARLTCGAHLGPPVLTRKQKRQRVNSLVCDRAAAFCAAGPPEALFWMSRLVTQAAKHERELARAHSQRLKQATLSLPGESVSRGFADRGALEGYPSHYTSLTQRNGVETPFTKILWDAHLANFYFKKLCLFRELRHNHWPVSKKRRKRLTHGVCSLSTFRRQTNTLIITQWSPVFRRIYKGYGSHNFPVRTPYS